jgi:hypothetical protein
MPLLLHREGEVGMEAIMSVFQMIRSILVDLLWYGVTQWFGRQFEKTMTEGPDLDDWQKALDEKLKQEPVVDPLQEPGSSPGLQKSKD